MPDMNAVKISTREGDGEGGVGDDQAGQGVEHAEVEVDGVEAHRHDDAGDHLRDQQHEAQRRRRRAGAAWPASSRPARDSARVSATVPRPTTRLVPR